jgi:hypothetical protein
LQDSLSLEIKSESFYVADQPALPVADVGQRFGKTLAVPVKPRPVSKLMDIQVIAARRK